jgi:hypothetical protein
MVDISAQGEGATGISRRSLVAALAPIWRVVPLLVALASLTLALAVVTAESHAGAASTSTVTCKGFELTKSSGLVTIRGCTPSAGRGYAFTTGPSSTLGPGARGQGSGGTLTWKGGATTTIGASTFTATENDTCPSKKNRSFDGAWVESALVTGASTAGPGIPAVGDAVSATVCDYLKFIDHYETETAILEPGSAIGL